MYDPTIGRWTSQDPIGFTADDANLYRYVGNNPANNLDPSGLSLIALSERAAQAVRGMINHFGLTVRSVKLPSGNWYVYLRTSELNQVNRIPVNFPLLSRSAVRKTLEIISEV